MTIDTTIPWPTDEDPRADYPCRGCGTTFAWTACEPLCKWCAEAGVVPKERCSDCGWQLDDDHNPESCAAWVAMRRPANPCPDEVIHDERNGGYHVRLDLWLADATSPQEALGQAMGVRDAIDLDDDTNAALEALGFWWHLHTPEGC